MKCQRCGQKKHAGICQQCVNKYGEEMKDAVNERVRVHVALILQIAVAAGIDLDKNEDNGDIVMLKEDIVGRIRVLREGERPKAPMIITDVN